MIKNIYNRVFSKIRSNSAFRDNDRLLQLDIWREEGLLLSPEQERAFMRVSSPESIRRARQKVQEQYPQYRASRKIMEARREKEYEVKSEIINDKQAGKAISWLND